MADDLLAKQARWRRTTSSWVKKAVRVIGHTSRQSKHWRWLAGYEAAHLLQDLLDAAEELVPLLNDDQDYEIEVARTKAQALAKALRNRELAPKLAQTKGRTPEEAEMFAAKARSLAGADA